MVIRQAHLSSRGIIATLLLAPLGISALLRNVAVPIAVDAFGEALVSHLPLFALAAGFAILFSQYAFVGKTLFDGFFPRPLGTTAPDPRSSIIKKLCAKHGLTEREATIAHYITQGYSLDKTATLLTISPNTVRTHYRSIYLNFDIHSRQELIDLVDAEPPFAEEEHPQ